MTIKQKIFVIISILFFLGVGYFVYDMNSKTSKPWEKKKKEVLK
jgi:cbb3-type cytochrome oxidase subunit 3